MTLQIPVLVRFEPSMVWSGGIRTREDPGCLVNEDGSERFRVVGFKALDHEFDRCVVLEIQISMWVEIHDRVDEPTMFDNVKLVISKMIVCRGQQ